MCGIAFARGELPDRSHCLRAVAALAHRGPDASGVFDEDGLFIGHTRLKVLDLTHAADQPMTTPDGRYVLAYNGEIYNHAELRQRVERAGWSLRGHGDTEILLALLAIEGPTCIADLRGMFAFVLWDRHRKSLLAARDHLGIKPLYYAHTTKRTLVASELRAMAAFGAAGSLDPEAVSSFLLTSSVEQPRTMFAGVRALRPGHTLIVEDGRATERCFWTLPDHEATIAGSADELAEELDAILGDSVRRQLRADVPVATFLSGGLDSSLITAYAAEELGSDLQTFSIGFETAAPERWDETAAAALVSERYGTTHHKIVITSADFEDRMEDLVGAIDQPSADGFNTYFVCMAAAPSTTVALSGQGGDELFAGYNVFQLASRIEGYLARYPRPPRSLGQLGRRLADLPAHLQHNWYLRAAATMLTGGAPGPLVDTTMTLFSAGELGIPRASAVDGDDAGGLVDAVSRRLIQGYLVNTLLRDMDAMSMAHSLEVRVPLVDHRLAEFALSVPAAAKVSWGNPKSLLRGIGERRLPAELLSRPKQGFVFPLHEWLTHPACLARLRAALAPQEVARAGLIDPSLAEREIDRLLRPRRGHRDWLTFKRVWGLYVLHVWHDRWQRDRLPELHTPVRSLQAAP